MKRDAIPTPGPAALPGQVGQRNGRLVVSAAMLALYRREYTIKALANHLAELHPDQPINMPDLVAMLINRGDCEFVDDTLGLTEQGEDNAEKLQERLTLKPSRTRLSEQERRTHALASILIDPALLTGGQRRHAASAADLAPPAMRPGSEACLALPSRIGNALHYRDGRVTSMDGTELQPPRNTTCYTPTRDGRNPDQRMGWRESQHAW